ncbi:hypothetical protein EA472_01720 [Natrarchaeobius oligotrophus]|uniref:Uncharacterized protein n=1 Tax=Natrarchaeobius chitinivorans TaxID=1679083 RepID=A0A3N6N345_NATCH|nr:hypothetical protein EA472_01720 [Natrarchaeobius chitinivorans]
MTCHPGHVAFVSDGLPYRRLERPPNGSSRSGNDRRRSGSSGRDLEPDSPPSVEPERCGSASRFLSAGSN